MKIRVYYEDTDAGGIVYHSRYLNFCERARSETFFSQGLIPQEGEENIFVVHTLKAEYLSMARLGDLLAVKSDLLLLRQTSLSLEQKIYRDDHLLFRMEITLVYLKRGKPSKIPEAYRNIFTHL